MDNSENKVYEIAFNIVPTLSEEIVAAEFGNLKDALTKLGGSVITEQYPKPMNLAYIMERVIANKNNKFGSAHFGWIKFEAPAQAVVELKKSLDRNENIIRTMIIKTVRENTMAPKKIYRPELSNKRRYTPQIETSEETAMDKEAVDKKLDELIVA
jgi:ribosomal protein S6